MTAETTRDVPFFDLKRDSRFTSIIIFKIYEDSHEMEASMLTKKSCPFTDIQPCRPVVRCSISQAQREAVTLFIFLRPTPF
jgi:hypothetical protein